MDVILYHINFFLSVIEVASPKRLAPGTINTWDLLKKAFIQRYCPPSMTTKQLEDIHNFKQDGEESLYQAWEQYNDLLYKCPTHDINNHQKVNIFYKGLSSMNRQLLDSQGPIPGMRPAEALTAIQTMADHSQKWHDGTTSRNIRSSSSKDGLAALVGCQICEGPHLDKDCPLNKEVKQVEEVRYGEFGRTAPFNRSNEGNSCVGPPGYYTKTDNRPPYYERRQSLEELLVKHQEESARRSTEMEIEQLTEELCSRKEKYEQAKVVIVEPEGPSSPKKIKNLHGISFLSNSQEENTNDQLPTKESNPRHFTLPCTISNFNFCAMADLGSSVNVLPRNIFEYLELTNLSETEILVEMADMRKKAPLGIVRDILIKIDKFLFPFDFVILDQTPNSTVILGRPFLATVHAQISVFEKEISVRIGDERVTFNINRNDPNFATTEGIFMLNTINTDELITKRLKINDDTTTTHFCKPIIQECSKDFKAWPSCSPFRNKCDGGHEIYGIFNTPILIDISERVIWGATS
ncbi:hypothetical protein Tco_0963510 [Tanacetum coccineum]